MKGVRLVISDAHEGLKQASSTVLETIDSAPAGHTFFAHRDAVKNALRHTSRRSSDKLRLRTLARVKWSLQLPPTRSASQTKHSTEATSMVRSEGAAQTVGGEWRSRIRGVRG